MNKITVSLGERSYDINIGLGTLKDLGALARRLHLGAKVLIITDPVIKKLYGAKTKASLEEAGFNVQITTVPQGEKSKNLKTAAALYQGLTKFKLQRDDTVVALGGGVIGDLAGFVAATYMRGINLIQVPTTLLAQVDSAIGGKTGVDLPKGKNLVGAFYQPRLVLVDLETLSTLPEREVTNGLAEVIKYAIIKSAKLFSTLEENKKVLRLAGIRQIKKDYGICDIWQKIISECCAIKAEVVSSDERESQYRMILNFGHTLGHAIETATVYKQYSHGEAIAIGMAAAASLSSKLGFLEGTEVNRIKNLIQALGLPLVLRKALSKEKLVSLLSLDKKIREQKIQFVLPKTMGEVIIFNEVPLAYLEAVLEGMGAI